MITIENYLDLSDWQKETLVTDLLHTSFTQYDFDPDKLNDMFRSSSYGTMPQFLFVFKYEQLTGYALLFGSESNRTEWSIDNSAELDYESGSSLIDAEIQTCLSCGDPVLAECCEWQKSMLVR